MKKGDPAKKILSTVSNFFIFFLLAAFVTTCCIMLFISTLQESIGREFTRNEITIAAKITMLNVIVLSIVMAIVDDVRRKLMVDKPVKMITDVAAQITGGDFSARVEAINGSGMEGFNQIGKAINAMAEELSGVETLRTDFIANVSHEMKTPLAVMQNYGTLLQTHGLSEEKRIEYAKAITDSVLIGKEEAASAVLVLAAGLTDSVVDSLAVAAAEILRLFLLNNGGKLDLLTLFVENADVKAERLKLLNKHLECLGNAGSGDILTLNDRLVSLTASVDVVRLDGQDLLKCICCTVCLECPNLHLSETLAAELRFTAERLLSYERVRTVGTGVDLIVNQMGVLLSFSGHR